MTVHAPSPQCSSPRPPSLGDRSPYCTINVTPSPCAAPPAAVAVTVICDVPNPVGASTVTAADPGEVASADVAVTLTAAGFGVAAGVVYNPVPSTVPFAPPPATVHVTLWLVELITVAVNCFSVTPAGHELPAKSANKVADAGLTVTVTTGGGPPPPPPATPPHETSTINPSPRQIPAIPP